MRRSTLAGFAVFLAIAAVAARTSGSGASTERVAGARGEGGNIVWSPNGQYIAFTGGTEARDDVVIVAVASGQKRLLVRGGGWPSWSPDGTRIAYENFDVFTIKLDRTGRKRVANNGSFPLWSPDGRHIMYARYGPRLTPLYVVPPAGGRAVRVARDGGHAQWSPDGKKIVLVTGAEVFGRTPGLVVVGSNGSSRRSLGAGEDPCWSPDGREIVFVVTDEDEETATVFAVRSNGTNRRQLARGGSPEFSPDGQRIAYVAGDDEIWLMNRDGSHRRRLTPPSPDIGVGDQAWSPDGRLLAYVRGSAIWIMNRDGTHPRYLTRL